VDAAVVVKKTSALDVTETVDVSSPEPVCAAVVAIFSRRYTHADLSPLTHLFTDFGRLYRGEYPGFFACDTQYHDMHHVLDVTLAAARLIDGYEEDFIAGGGDASQGLGAELAMIGIAVALFHDAGYIRRKGDSRHFNGAEYTKIHVSRSSRFLNDYLSGLSAAGHGLEGAAAIAAKLVHYTGYEFHPTDIDLDDPNQNILGALIGTADVVAQMADRAYLEKCRDRLFREFELGGIAREVDALGVEQVRYASPEDLLRQTPDFIRDTFEDRLDGLFGSLYHHAATHFGGRNWYVESIDQNRRHLEQLLSSNDEQLLRRNLRRTARA
jgi:hypothetical protein